MRIYLVNIDEWIIPVRGLRLITQQGHEVGGNWLAPPLHHDLRDFDPDVIIYAPHRRDTALRLELETVTQTPTVLWALYPDYLTGWNREQNTHSEGPLEPVQELLPNFRAYLANSKFTKDLLDARSPGYTFEVCYLGIDTQGIDAVNEGLRKGDRPANVLWHHRWSIDKNLQEALTIIRRLAKRHPDVIFYLGRKEDWDEVYWVPPSLKAFYVEVAAELKKVGNLQYAPRFETQEDYWRFIGASDIAFSCSYHETFGIAMLEQAYAHTACVVPERVAYPEVHAGSLLVPPAKVEAGIESLLSSPSRWRRVLVSSRANAARYDVAITVEQLLGILSNLD